MDNPFGVSFGTAPARLIHREKDLREIRDSFDAPYPRSRAFIISGARGVGKTVALAHLLDSYREKAGFVVARLDIGSDMLVQLAGSLCEEDAKAKVVTALAKEIVFSGRQKKRY